MERRDAAPRRLYLRDLMGADPAQAGDAVGEALLLELVEPGSSSLSAATISLLRFALDPALLAVGVEECKPRRTAGPSVSSGA